MNDSTRSQRALSCIQPTCTFCCTTSGALYVSPALPTDSVALSGVLILSSTAGFFCLSSAKSCFFLQRQ